jgi:hypothetical protein
LFQLAIVVGLNYRKTLNLQFVILVLGKKEHSIEDQKKIIREQQEDLKDEEEDET